MDNAYAIKDFMMMGQIFYAWFVIIVAKHAFPALRVLLVIL